MPHRHYQSFTPTRFRLWGYASSISAAFPANVEASEVLLQMHQGVLNWVYGSEPYELVKDLGEDGQGGGALGSLLLPRPAGPVPDRNGPVCPGTRLLVVNYGKYSIILLCLPPFKHS